MISHSWKRVSDSNVTTTTSANNQFAVYTSDRKFGVETSISNLAANTYYVLRHTISREYGLTEPILLVDQEQRYYRDESDPNDIRERFWTRTPGASWGTPTEVAGAPGGILILGTLLSNFADQYRYDSKYLQILGTTKVEFEFGIEGQTPLQSGLVGTYGGFDIRGLVIVDQEANKVRFNTVDEHVTFQAKLASYPLTSGIYTTPWMPQGNIDWGIGVGGLITTSAGGSFQTVYKTFQETVSTTGLTRNSTTGVFLDFEATWDGRFELISPVGEEVVGVAWITFDAIGLTPDADVVEARTKIANVECYTCINQNPGNVKECAVGLGGYNSHLSGLGVASMGYGWSEASHNKIEEDLQRGQIVVTTQGGGKMRWNIDGSSYIPSSRNLYTICEKDTSTAVDMSANSRTPRFTLTFKDQSKYQFNDSGRFIRQLDRNDNAVDYIYNSTTEQLDRVEVDGGLNIYYERRTDGQISKIREGDPNTGRLTEYIYLTASDPPELGPDDRLYKVINPEGEVTEYNYNSGGDLPPIYDPVLIRLSRSFE